MASSNTSSTISAIIPAGLEHLTDRYSDFALIGEGGHALVYKAQDKSLLKVVAIKVLHSRSISQEQVVRFQQEAKVLCKLKHPGLVTVLNFGTSPEGVPYLVLDYTDGCPLNEICNAGSTREALKLFVQLCEAMEHAHKQGVTHRDLKPSNILVDSTDHGLKVKILDFGIARVSEQSNPLGSNEIEGSPPYMSPEQIQGADVGRQSDIYSLGCVMFEALSGEPPYITDNAISTMTMHCKNAIPSLVNRSNGRTSPELSRIVTTCLAKRPEDRYRSMADLQKELEREIAVLMIQPEKQVETPLIAPCNNSKTWRVPATITASVVMLATPLFCLIPGADHVLPFLKSGDTASHTVA